MRKKAKFIFLSFLLFFNADFSFANDGQFRNFSTASVRGAVKRFDACVRGGQAAFDADHQICGVDAENRTELRGYLACPRFKNYMFSTSEVVDAKRGRVLYLYSCNGRPDVGIVIAFDGKKLSVAAIGVFED